MSILEKEYVVTMENGEKWSIPVSVIAQDRATYYAARDFGGDVGKSLKEDTAPLFSDDDYEIEDWAKNNMNWSDVEKHATLKEKGNTDYQEGWMNGEVEVL